ncbi:MAG: hypothetical protein Q9181_005349 [Wetmoreana brouardii]
MPSSPSKRAKSWSSRVHDSYRHLRYNIPFESKEFNGMHLILSMMLSETTEVQKDPQSIVHILGYFYPDLPKEHGEGDFVKFDDHKWFRSVDEFFQLIPMWIGGAAESDSFAALLRENLHLCLRGEAEAWYGTLDQQQKAYLQGVDYREGPDWMNLDRWRKALSEKFGAGDTHVPKTYYIDYNIEKVTPRGTRTGTFSGARTYCERCHKVVKQYNEPSACYGPGAGLLKH